MIKKAKAIAVIHARGGSKRIPLKNLSRLQGRPLISYPIELCKRCDWIERVIVSTDHDDIMEAARSWGAETPFRRPADISEDVPSELVTLHALNFLKDEGADLPDYVVSLTPATPFTKSDLLDGAFQMLLRNPEWDGVTAVRLAKEHPEWIVNFDDLTGEARTIFGNPMEGEYNVSQNLKRYYYPTGAFWINPIKTFLEHPGLYGNKWGAVVIDADKTVDIDWPEDLITAEKLAKSTNIEVRRTK